LSRGRACGRLLPRGAGVLLVMLVVVRVVLELRRRPLAGLRVRRLAHRGTLRWAVLVLRLCMLLGVLLVRLMLRCVLRRLLSRGIRRWLSSCFLRRC